MPGELKGWQPDPYGIHELRYFTAGGDPTRLVRDGKGWQPDPYGIHELRYFTADGNPTRLVRDGGGWSNDEPPQDSTGFPLSPPTERSAQHPPGTQPTASATRSGLGEPALSAWEHSNPTEQRMSRAVDSGPLLTPPPEARWGTPVAHPADWYQDPSNPDQLRYWDGVGWTQHTREVSLAPSGSAAALIIASAASGMALTASDMPATSIPMSGEQWGEPPGGIAPKGPKPLIYKQWLVPMISAVVLIIIIAVAMGGSKKNPGTLATTTTSAAPAVSSTTATTATTSTNAAATATTTAGPSATSAPPTTAATASRQVEVTPEAARTSTSTTSRYSLPTTISATGPTTTVPAVTTGVASTTTVPPSSTTSTEPSSTTSTSTSSPSSTTTTPLATTTTTPLATTTTTSLATTTTSTTTTVPQSTTSTTVTPTTTTTTAGTADASTTVVQAASEDAATSTTDPVHPTTTLIGGDSSGNATSDTGSTDLTAYSTSGSSLALTGVELGIFWVLFGGSLLFVIGLIGRRHATRRRELQT